MVVPPEVVVVDTGVLKLSSVKMFTHNISQAIFINSIVLFPDPLSTFLPFPDTHIGN